MNFLAHLALAGPECDLVVGGFVGDFVKGPLPGSLHPALVPGVKLHRAIDAYSDSHRLLTDLRQELPPQWRRCAGILLDMMTDHYLATTWHRWYDSSLEAFATACDHQMASRWNLIPGPARKTWRHIAREKWLVRYADLDFTRQAICGIGQRLRGDNPLGECDRLLEDRYTELNYFSHQLYAELQLYVAEWRTQNLSTRE